MRRAVFNIERDQTGLPCRLLVGTVQVTRFIRPLYVNCPRCKSGRMAVGRCLDCWHDTGREIAQIVTADEDVYTS